MFCRFLNSLRSIDKGMIMMSYYFRSSRVFRYPDVGLNAGSLNRTYDAHTVIAGVFGSVPKGLFSN